MDQRFLKTEHPRRVQEDAPLWSSSVGINQLGLVTTARVIDCFDRGVTVAIDDERVTAIVAFGCLVQPAPGDRVLLYRNGGEAYVLSVLERLLPAPAVLALPGKAALQIEGSSLTLSAQDRIGLAAPSMEIVSPRFSLVSDTLTMLGKLATIVADTLRFSSRTQETTADRVAVRAQDRISIIDRTDILRTDCLVEEVKSVSTTSANSAIIATREELRLDGKRVTVG